MNVGDAFRGGSRQKKEFHPYSSPQFNYYPHMQPHMQPVPQLHDNKQLEDYYQQMGNQYHPQYMQPFFYHPMYQQQMMNQMGQYPNYFITNPQMGQYMPMYPFFYGGEYDQQQQFQMGQQYPQQQNIQKQENQKSK